jgi:pyruvate dehydrogenase kinase 2/3/4
MRAILESSDHDPSSDIPDIEVLIARTQKNDVAIRVRDSGVGIRRENVPYLFHFNYSTAPRPRISEVTGKADVNAVAGFGYGIPMSRLYARYLKGDVVYNSVHGVGTDATLYLRSNASSARELLPVYNASAVEKYADVKVGAEDWTDARYVRGRVSGSVRCILKHKFNIQHNFLISAA